MCTCSAHVRSSGLEVATEPLHVGASIEKDRNEVVEKAATCDCSGQLQVIAMEGGAAGRWIPVDELQH